ncbi:flagellar hook-basal body complex protein FliE [Magnetospira sp. QH-2]|uniref:flagellar hook-basal body complex protein FliE n=1 Tax=Magnetospira sp. (strain QH-2) TaxID=1288970 RepID=UPI0003E816DD|nr:flagellar hook-basal body complex protein FliE [Magnetospira sp. QH-2]CCQ74107.1 Flagellar hook-basal body complex protein FliE [Magnetospira sp. QH-2]
MPIDPTAMSNAISAYGNKAQSIRDAAPASGGSAAEMGQDDFSSLVKSAIREAVHESKQTEQLSVAAAFNKADVNQVVTAVAEAEVTLKTVVSVRDKMVEAYKEILRTPM